jgi:hypothetical protein
MVIEDLVPEDDPTATWVCGTCGVPIARTSSNAVVHIDSIPEDFELHDAFPWMTRREYLLQQTTVAERRSSASPGERSALALERLADAAERLLAVVLDSRGPSAVRSGPNPEGDPRVRERPGDS